MSVTFEDNTDNVIDKIKRQERLALALATEQIKSEAQRIRPPQVQTGFFRATIYVSGQALNISGDVKQNEYGYYAESENYSVDFGGKAEAYEPSKDRLVMDVISGASYGGLLEFYPFSRVGVLAPFRKGAVKVAPIIDKIFQKYLTL